MDPIYSNYSPIFLYVNQYSFSEKWVYQESHVPYSLVRYICSGSATFEVNGVAHEVHKDSVFYIPQGCTLNCVAHEPLVFISVRFIGSIQLPETDMLKQLWNIGQLYDFSQHAQMKGWFQKIHVCAIKRNTYKRLETRAYLNLILAAMRSVPYRKYMKRISAIWNLLPLRRWTACATEPKRPTSIMTPGSARWWII